MKKKNYVGYDLIEVFLFLRFARNIIKICSDDATICLSRVSLKTKFIKGSKLPEISSQRRTRAKRRS
jgi:hypothetical protein